MSLLSYTQLCRLIEDGVITGSPAVYDAVNSASIDLHLGPKILVERLRPENRFKHLSARDKLEMVEHDCSCEGGYNLYPGQFILAQTLEVFNLPDTISAEYKLKSSMARMGLDHLNAGWADAGWHCSVLTLELKNTTENHVIVLKAGDRIGQMVFFQHEPVPEDKSYAVRGSYNNNREVTGAIFRPNNLVQYYQWAVAKSMEDAAIGRFVAGPFATYDEAASRALQGELVVKCSDYPLNLIG